MNFMSQPEAGPAMMPAIGRATMKVEMALARRLLGYQ